MNDYLRNKYLIKTYGITLDDYNKILDKQNHRCAICEKPKEYFKTALAVDHDHKTGKVRGALCFPCNKRFVGRHTAETVVKLVKYLLPDYKLVKKKS